MKSFCLLSALALSTADLGAEPLGLEQAGVHSSGPWPTLGGDVKALTDTFVEGGTVGASALNNLDWISSSNPALVGTWSQIDANQMFLASQSSLTFWVVGSSGDNSPNNVFNNTFGYNPSNNFDGVVNNPGDYTLTGGDDAIIFTDTTVSDLATPANGSTVTLANEGTDQDTDKTIFSTTLQGITGADPGDFPGGAKLDFFLIQDGSGNPGGTDMFWTNPNVVAGAAGAGSINVDGQQHAMAFTYDKDNQYLLLAWEHSFMQQGTGTGDYNDVFVLIQAPGGFTAIPEPGTYLMLGSFIAFAMVAKRRKESVIVE